MLNPQEMLAVVKVIKKAAEKAARKELQPGDYPIDLSVRIAGSIRVGEAYEERIVATADAWLLLAIALSKLNGITIESIVREALACSLDPIAIKDQANAAIAAIKDSTLTPCLGKVTTSLAIAKLSK